MVVFLRQANHRRTASVFPYSGAKGVNVEY